tara:strand:+ start:355 stop:528 length:174 start_codon:yes stop_codon:yes gene_type:complete
LLAALIWYLSSIKPNIETNKAISEMKYKSLFEILNSKIEIHKIIEIIIPPVKAIGLE